MNNISLTKYQSHLVLHLRKLVLILSSLGVVFTHPPMLHNRSDTFWGAHHMINICLLKNAFCVFFSKYLSKQLNSCIGYLVNVFFCGNVHVVFLISCMNQFCHLILTLTFSFSVVNNPAQFSFHSSVSFGATQVSNVCFQ